MADMGEVGIQLRLAFSSLKIIILNKRQVEDLVHFSQVQNETSVMIMGTII